MRAALILALLGASPQGAGAWRTLVDARDASAWQAKASEQVEATLRRDPDGSLCLDYDFHGVSGYAVLRHTLPVDWPRVFALRARLKGRGPVNDFQLKLVDQSGDNVWWVSRPSWAPPATLEPAVFKSRQVTFAWGPVSDRTLRRTQDLELVIAAREGGKGALCVASLELQEREVEPAVWPEPVARRTAHALELDLLHLRDLEGLTLQWPDGVRRPSYDVAASVDGRTFTTLRRVAAGAGGFAVVYLPDSEARYLRITSKGSPPPLRAEVRDPKQWPGLNAVMAELARHLPRGHVPRAFTGEQNYWALVGVDGAGDHSALVSEDGAVEVGRGGFSVEPAVMTDDGQIVTWADVSQSQSLLEGSLPLPQVRWDGPELALEVTAAADGPARAPELLARYAVTNTAKTPRVLTLLLAVRPWQVNPPQQFLNTPGGVSRVASLSWQAPQLTVNHAERLSFASAPGRVTAMPLAGGLDLRALRDAEPLRELSDPQEHASALLAWPLQLAPGETRVVTFTAPLGGGAAAESSAPTPTRPSPASIDERQSRVASTWRARQGRLELTLPPSARRVQDSLRAALSAILMSREGPGLRPGTRSYARTWIRDGAMMTSSLLRMGELDIARAFVDWYAGHVYPSGRVPCCVDRRGSDPVVENDSNGELLFAVAEVWRYSRDRAFLARHWPVVQRVVGAMEALRQSTRTEEFAKTHPSNLVGLMPPSISHEGYSDKPAYSYWDDFWTLRGYKDAVVIAQAQGEAEVAESWAGFRDQFEAELSASIEATAARFGLDVIAGAADRGDVDETSTTIGPNIAQARLPPKLLEQTFARYWQKAQRRFTGAAAWHEYSPYEVRVVASLVRLGHVDRAHELLGWMLRDQRPPGFAGWAEVVVANPREPWFLGDMPHAWIESDYVTSVLDMFAYARDADESLVIGAGLHPQWLASHVGVRGLATPYGRLAFGLSPVPGGHVFTLEGGLAAPPGGVRLVWTPPGKLPRATTDAGQKLTWVGRELTLPGGAVTVRLIDE